MEYTPRDVEKTLYKWLPDREILLLRGPRQSGKTTLLERLREKLKEGGVSEEHIHFVSFEDDLERLKFEENPKEYVSFLLKEGRNYLLLDEVQYVKDIGKKLKLLFDSFPNAKIIASGSSSFDLTNLGAFLVGRVILIDVLPFSFGEFLRSKGGNYEQKYGEVRLDIGNSQEPKKTILLPDLNKLLREYLRWGSYPRIALEADRAKKEELLKNMFATYVEKDVVSRYGNKYRDSGVKLLRAVSSSIGGIAKYETLAQAAGIAPQEARQILPLLEDSFVIYRCTPFHRNLESELRKNPKIYFVDYGIRNYLLGSFEPPDFGPLYENFVHNQLKYSGPVRYWRTTAKTEVDFILEKDSLIPVEAKSGGKPTRSLGSFISKYKAKVAYIGNIEGIGKRKIGGCQVFFAPFAYF